MAKRRGNQEGAIYQRKNGRWQAQLVIQGHRFSRSFFSRKECQVWIRETLNQKDRGLTSDSFSSTFGEFWENWLSIVKPRLRINTWLQYKGLGKYHLLPALGDLQLSQIKPMEIQSLYAAKLKAGFGTRTVQLMHAVLRNALRFAEKQGVIPVDPTRRVDKPKLAKKEMEILTDDQVRGLLIVAGDKDLGVLLQVAITTGMRRGELLGLRWSDVDWAAATIRVRRQLQRIPDRGLVFSEPKSKSGIRTVQLGSYTLKKLMQYKNCQDREFAAGENKENLIFPSSDGTPKEPRVLVTQFKALLVKAGINPKIRIHDLRHTAASLMLMSGMELIRIARQLGHSKPSITLDIYGHLIPGLENDAAQRLDELVTPTIAADLQQQTVKRRFEGQN